MEQVQSASKGTYLYPILIPRIEPILRARMLDDETLPAVVHDLIHLLSDIFSRSAAELLCELQSPRNLLDASPHVLLAVHGGLLKDGLAVQIQEVKHFD